MGIVLLNSLLLQGVGPEFRYSEPHKRPVRIRVRLRRLVLRVLALVFSAMGLLGGSLRRTRWPRDVRAEAPG